LIIQTQRRHGLIKAKTWMHS